MISTSISTTPSPPSALLSLPPELRNRIFAYTLTSRTQILQYAPSPKANHHRPVFSDPSSSHPTRDFNQLKYVCRQLYLETAGLEIKYNALRFDLPEDDAYTLARIQNSLDSGYDYDVGDGPDLPGTSNSTSTSTSISFPPFLYTIHPSKLPWLHHIIITIRKPASYSLSQPTVDRLLSLARFKRENPRVEITYEYVDEVYEYKAPKWQVGVPWLSVAVCLGVALPVPGALKPVVDVLMGWCGRGNLVLWGLGFGVWDLVGMR